MIYTTVDSTNKDMPIIIFSHDGPGQSSTTINMTVGAAELFIQQLQLSVRAALDIEEEDDGKPVGKA